MAGGDADRVGEPEPSPWELTRSKTSPAPGRPDLQLVSRAQWRNQRVRFGGRARHLTTAQRREMLRRDGYACSVPGCRHSIWLDVHHIVFFCEGGPTVPTNLVVTCTRCHRNLHEGRLRVSGSAPDGLVWTDARGRRMDRFPGYSVPDWLGEWLEAGDPVPTAA